MRWRPPDILLFTALVLAIAAAGAVAASGPDAEEARASREVTGALHGGPGMGRAVDLSRCPSAFDLRLGAACSLRYTPFPGADGLCPDHAFLRERPSR